MQDWWRTNSGRVFAPNIEKYLFERHGHHDAGSD
jgi:hypothetical protein